MKKYIVTFLLLTPLSAFGVSANYQAWTCDGANYRLSQYGPEDILKVLRNAFNLPVLTYDTTISEAGGFTKKAELELNILLKAQGFPSAEFLNADEINLHSQTLRMSDLKQMLLQGWSDTLCR